MAELRLLRPLRERPLALVWGGLLTSAVGDQLFIVVLSWIAVRIFGTSAGYLAMLQAAIRLAALLLLGRFADRFRQRHVMVAADLACAAVLLLMVAAWLGHENPPAWSLVAAVVVLAGGVAVFHPALQASLPGLVTDRSLLPAANALLDTTERIARLLGPGIIGLAGALLPLVHFVTIDAATFLVSAAAVLASLRLRSAGPPPPRRRESAVAAVLRGFATVRRHRLLVGVLSVNWIINGTFYAAYFLGLPLMLGRPGIASALPGGGLADFGLVIATYGVSNGLATLVLGNLRPPLHPGRMIFAGQLAFGLGTLTLGASVLLLPPGWVLAGFMAGAALAAIGGPMQDILVATISQTELPHADLPAAVRAFMTVASLGVLLTLALAPSAFNLFGVAPAIIASGALVAMIGVGGMVRFWAYR